MKYLNSDELAKIIQLDYSGRIYNGYKFKITNSPTIRTNKSGKVLSCTCRLHSIKDIEIKRNCRYILAYEIWKNQQSPNPLVMN